MELHHLRYFVAVAELLSFRRAAERLHLSRPPLTRQIHALEAELGVRLLERERRRAVVLTDAGRAFLAQAKQVLQKLESAGVHARRAAQGTGGQLRLAGCAVQAAPALNVYLPEFRRLYPDVEVAFTAITHAEEPAALDNGSAHLVLSAAFGDKIEPRFRSRIISTVDVAVALPASHPLALRRQVSVGLDALGEETLLCPASESEPNYVERLHEIWSRAHLSPGRVRQVDGFENILAMVSAGYGVAILAGGRVPNQPPPGCRIKRLRLPLLAYQLRMLWKQDNSSQVLRRFLSATSKLVLPKVAGYSVRLVD